MDLPVSGPVLLLQGPPCSFWRELGQGLEAAGRPVIHVGFHLGDVLWWRRRGQRIYRGGLETWSEWLGDLIKANGIEDVLYYADRLPYHAVAIDVCRDLGVRCWAIENGYLRPDWLTMEPEGMGICSRFPRNPEAIRALSDGLEQPDLTPRYQHGFAQEAASEVLYHLAMTAGRPLFLKYQSDKYYPPVLDYLCWLRRWALGGAARRAVATVSDAMAADAWPFYLVALQLQSDYQIRASSPYRCLSEMLSDVVLSFAQHAPRDSRLVIKLHPMDNGWENWPRRISELARDCRVATRVIAIDGGDLAALLDTARGLVTVNSTVGLHALRSKCPVVALGNAVYDVSGLTHQTGLDHFWNQPERPDPTLVRDFVTALAGHIQIRGSFYDPGGRSAAVAEIARRLNAPDMNASAPIDRDAPAADPLLQQPIAAE